MGERERGTIAVAHSPGVPGLAHIVPRSIGNVRALLGQYVLDDDRLPGIASLPATSSTGGTDVRGMEPMGTCYDIRPFPARHRRRRVRFRAVQSEVPNILGHWEHFSFPILM